MNCKLAKTKIRNILRAKIFGGLMLSVVLAVASVSVGAQGPPAKKVDCDAIKTLEQERDKARQELEKAEKEWAEVKKNMPSSKDTTSTPKPKPTATLATLKAELAKSKKCKETKEAAATKLKEFQASSEGTRLSTLTTETDELRKNIRKALDAQTRLSQSDKVALIELESAVQEANTKVRSNLSPDVTAEKIREKIADTSYQNNDPSRQPRSKPEDEGPDPRVQAAQELLKFTAFTNTVIDKKREELEKQITRARATFLTLGDKNPWDEIVRLGPELIGEIKKAQSATRENLSALDSAKTSLDSKIKEVFPGETGKLVNELPANRQSLNEKTTELKPLAEKQATLEKSNQEAAAACQELRAADTIQGEIDVLTATTQQEALTKAEAKKNTAKTNADTATKAYDTAVTAVNTAAATALTTARQKFNEILQQYGKDKNEVKNEAIKNAKEKLAQDPQNALLTSKMQKATNEEEKNIAKNTLKNYRRSVAVTIFKELMNKKRLNATTVEQLRALADTLKPYLCFEDVNKLYQEIHAKINELNQARAGLVSDVEDPMGEDLDLSDLDTELEEGKDKGKDKNKGKPATNELPPDIIKDTGEVKVTPYYVLLLSTGGLYVGTEDSLKGRPSCGFEGGGRDCSFPIKWSRLAGPFGSQEEAQAELCRSITQARVFPLGIGLKGQWRGSNKWYGLWEAGVDGCPKKTGEEK